MRKHTQVSIINVFKSHNLEYSKEIYYFFLYLGEPTHICNLCEKAFLHPRQLRNHLFTVHQVKGLILKIIIENILLCLSIV